jgi:TPR repeat protein
MIKGRVVGVLAVEAGDCPATDAREPRDQMPLPTLDERANLYLRAVYGDRDFTNEEYSGARNLMLNAMAADIVARSNARSLDGVSLSAEVPDRLTLANPFLEIGTLEPSYEPPTVDRSSGDVGFSDHRASKQAVEGFREAALRKFQALPHIRLPPVFSGGRPAKRTAAAYAAVAVLAVAVFWLTAVLSTAWFAPHAPSHDPRVAVQPSQPDASGRTPLASDRYTLAEAEREVISALNAAQLGPDEIGALLKRGQELIAAGKFRLARLVLEQAAEAGSAPAALALGRTYDPTLLERSGVRPDAAPDTAMAWAWYQKAKHLGSAEAARRLGQLPAPK